MDASRARGVGGPLGVTSPARRPLPDKRAGHRQRGLHALEAWTPVLGSDGHPICKACG